MCHQWRHLTFVEQPEALVRGVAVSGLEFHVQRTTCGRVDELTPLNITARAQRPALPAAHLLVYKELVAARAPPSSGDTVG